MRKGRTRLPRWLGALLAPADDPRQVGQPPSPNVNAVLADLRTSRAELADLRRQLEARAALVELDPAQSERLQQHVRELAEQEQELLRAEHALGLSLEERRAQQVLEVARLRALEAELQVD